MVMVICKVKIEGTRPLLMHNGRLADPIDPATKKLSAAAKKKQKSDDEIAEVGRLEFEGSLYFDSAIGPYLPVDNLQAMIIEGARKRKMGKDFESLVEVAMPTAEPEGYRLDYQGPRDPAGLWNAPGFKLRKQARVGQSRVVRTRPRFARWSCRFEVEILDDGPDPEHVKRALEDAGRLIGIGDWSPRYGRFTLEEFKA
jgi:hypothetical protein